jgi:hypothetical protein
MSKFKLFSEKNTTVEKYAIVWVILMCALLVRGLYWAFMDIQGATQYISNNTDGKLMFELGYISILIAISGIISLVIRKK